MTIRDQLSRELRDTFPGLTVARVEAIWKWVVRMERGKVYLSDADLVDPNETIVALHLARELAFFNTTELQKIIKRLSAHGKRTAFPKSYGV